MIWIYATCDEGLQIIMILFGTKGHQPKKVVNHWLEVTVFYTVTKE